MRAFLAIALFPLLAAAAPTGLELGGVAKLQQGRSSTALELWPELSFQAQSPAARLSLGYSPWLRLSELSRIGEPVRLGQRAFLSGKWDARPGLLLFADQRLLLGPGDAVDLQLGLSRALRTLEEGLAPVEDLLSSETELALLAQLLPRLALKAGAGYWLSGGLSPLSRSLVPLHQGPLLQLWLDYSLTRRDTLSSELSAGRTFGGRGGTFFRATQSWQHWLSPGLRSELGGGAGLVSSGPSSTFLPVLRAGLFHQPAWWGQLLSLRAALSLAPERDSFTGEPLHRAEARAELSYRLGRELSWKALATAGRELFTLSQREEDFLRVGSELRLSLGRGAEAGAALLVVRGARQGAAFAFLELFPAGREER